MDGWFLVTERGGVFLSLSVFNLDERNSCCLVIVTHIFLLMLFITNTFIIVGCYWLWRPFCKTLNTGGVVCVGIVWIIYLFCFLTIKLWLDSLQGRLFWQNTYCWWGQFVHLGTFRWTPLSETFYVCVCVCVSACVCVMSAITQRGSDTPVFNPVFQPPDEPSLL